MGQDGEEQIIRFTDKLDGELTEKDSGGMSFKLLNDFSLGSN